MANAVSVKDVARHAQVSLGTVSNVLNRPETVAEATRERVLASIEQLGYVRNEAARHLRAGRSHTIGFVVMDVSNPFFTDVARSAERTAAASGSSLLIANSGDDPVRERSHLDLFEEQRAQGVLISPTGDISANLARLRGRGIPTVLVDSASPSDEFSSVRADDVAGGRMAAEHLLGLGRTRIAFVGGPLSFHQLRDRADGARQAVASAGARELQVWETDSPTVDAGRDAARRMLDSDEHPDAIFAGNDLLAIGVMQSLLLERRWRIPEDVALVGYDDIGWAASALVPLSSVRQPSALIGSKAAELLIGESLGVEGFRHEQVLFTPELIARTSTLGVSSRSA